MTHSDKAREIATDWLGDGERAKTLAAQITAALREAEDAALEKAARAAESEEEEPDTPEDEAMVAGYNRAIREIAAAIRNLKNYGDA